MTDHQALPLPDGAIKAAAEIRWRQYASEYNADHLTWRDFADEARELLAAAADVLRAQGAATEREACAQLAEKRAEYYESDPEAQFDVYCYEAITLREFADLIRARTTP